MTTLYDITADRLELMDELLQCDGELNPELEARLDAIDKTEREKAYNYAAQMATWESEVEELKGKVAYWQLQIDRVRPKIKARENGVKSLKGRMLAHLKAVGKDALDTGSAVFGKWRRRKNTIPAIRALVDLELVPKEFVRLSLDGDAAQRAYRENRLPDCLEAKLGEHVRLT